MEITYEEQNLDEVARQLIENYSNYKIWVFNGEMGAGKTTLIKSLCKEKGVKDEMMSSPTFSIVNEYLSEDGNLIYHFDFYRLKNQEEALDIGVEDYFFSDNECYIEWVDIVLSLLPSKYVEININLVSHNRRTLIAMPNE